MSSSVIYRHLEEKGGFHTIYICACLKVICESLWVSLCNYLQAADLVFLTRRSIAQLGSQKIKDCGARYVKCWLEDKLSLKSSGPSSEELYILLLKDPMQSRRDFEARMHSAFLSTTSVKSTS
jgi:hypothetical protein